MRKIHTAALALFSLSTITSMAGMEIFGWLLFAMGLATLLGEPGSRKVLIQPVLLAAYALVFWIGIGLWWNGGTWQAFAEARWVLSLIGLALAFHVTFEQKSALKWLWVLVGVGTLIAAYSVAQYWTGQDWLRGARSPLLLIEESRHTGEWRYRPYGLFKMTLTYACSFAMFGLLPMCVAFYERGFNRLLLLGASTLIFLSVFMTFSRGVWISLACALMIVLWQLSRKALLATGVALAMAGALAFSASPLLRERVFSVADMKHVSNFDRMNLWRANWLMFTSHPFVGVGYELNGPPNVTAYYERLRITSEFKSHAHNNYLNFLSGTGAPGFLFFLMFAGGALLISWRNVRRIKTGPVHYLALASLGAQVVLHVGGLTEYNFGDAEVQYQYLAHVAFNLYLHSKSA